MDYLRNPYNRLGKQLKQGKGLRRFLNRKKNRVARVLGLYLGQLQKQFDYSYRYLLITGTVMFNSPRKDYVHVN